MTIANRVVKPGGFVGSTRPKSAIRGFLVHMAEGNNVAAYLSRDPARGVSVQYTVEADGEIIAMVPELRSAGSVNPNTIRTTTVGYYGADHARHVLGDLWQNPNRGVIAIEVAGRAKDGPNGRQIASLVRLFLDCRTRYPGIKPLGHRDLQSVKPCPGSTVAIKRAFTWMGGHGLDYQREASLVSTIDYRPDHVADVTDGADLFDRPGGKVIGTASAPLTRDWLGRSPDRKAHLVSSVLDGKPRTAWVLNSDVGAPRPALAWPPDPAALAAARKQGIADAAAAAKGVV